LSTCYASHTKFLTSSFESFTDLLSKVDHVEIANDSMRMQVSIAP
jgi:hypothetical protein